MAKSATDYSVKLAGPGISFDRPISPEIANRIINLVMTGNAEAVAPFQQFSTASAQPTPGTVGLSQPVVGTIKQFIAQKRPNNVYQRVACLAYFLTHAANTPHFKTKDISKANTDAAGPKLSNAASFVRDATSKYGYLSAAGKGAKQITVFGEDVVQALPDQEKVKHLHADNSTRGRKKSRRRSG
jgi:hypothetical protein